jgi:hypothetical protein
VDGGDPGSSCAVHDIRVTKNNDLKSRWLHLLDWLMAIKPEWRSEVAVTGTLISARRLKLG